MSRARSADATFSLIASVEDTSVTSTSNANALSTNLTLHSSSISTSITSSTSANADFAATIAEESLATNGSGSFSLPPFTSCTTSTTSENISTVHVASSTFPDRTSSATSGVYIPIYANICRNSPNESDDDLDLDEIYDDTIVIPDFHLNIFTQERRLALELNSICKSQKEKNRSETAKIFYKMGLIYRAKSPDKFSLIRAAALFNASKVRDLTKTDKITLKLIELGDHIQSLAGAKHTENLVTKANELSNTITAMRSKVQTELDTVKPIESNLDRSALLKCEVERVKIVRSIQHFLTEDYIKIMRDLSEFCNHVMGPPPCQYAVVGMGSLARKEVTPYSDFEHAIVLNESCKDSEQNYASTLEHFRWYSVIFHVVVINLMETIIPSVAIPCLNDFSSAKGNWFFDAYSNRGISFDGMMAHACKFPLGRQEETLEKPFIAELIKPVDEMLHYLDLDVSLKHGYHLGDILTKTCFIYGNDELYNKFSQAVKQKLQLAYEERCFGELKVQLEEDLFNFAIGEKAINTLKSKEKLNVKRLVYRSTTLFIAAWGRLEGIDASSSFDVVSKLCDKHIISLNQKHKLMYAVALACEIRLKVYFEKNKQDDIINPNQSLNESGCHPILNVVGERSLVNYFQIAYALQLQMCQMLNLEPSHLIRDPAMLNFSLCSALGLYKMTDNLLLTCTENASPNINMYNFDECLLYLESMLDGNVSPNVSTTKLSSREIADRFRFYTEHFMNMQKFDKAFDYALQALKISKAISSNSIFQAKCCELVGACLVQTKRYRKGWFYFENSLKIFRNLSIQQIDISPDQFVSTYHYIGICLVRCNYFHKAKAHFHKALSMYKEHSSHKNIADSTFYIGLCLSKLEDYPLSDLYLKKSLKMYEELVNCQPCCSKEHVECLLTLVVNHSTKPNLSNDIIFFRSTLSKHMDLVFNSDVKSTNMLFSIGKLLLDLNFLDFSLNFLEETLKICQNSKDDSMEQTICHIYCYIGLCLQKKQSYNLSLVYLQDSLCLFQSISANINEDINVALSYQKIGLCLLDMNLTKDANINFRRALEIFKCASETEESQRQLAALHNDIGVCNMEMHDYEQALEHFRKSLDTMSDNFPNPEIVNSEDLTPNNMGKCLMKMQRFDEALQVLRKALRIQKKFQVTSSCNDIVVTMNNLGLCLMEQNKWNSSYNCFEKAYNLCLQTLKSGSAFAHITRKEMADTLNNLGLMYICAKDYKTAINSFHEALAYYDSVSATSDKNEDVFLVYNNLGLCYMSVKSYQKSFKLFSSISRIFRKSVSIS